MVLVSCSTCWAVLGSHILKLTTRNVTRGAARRRGREAVGSMLRHLRKDLQRRRRRRKYWDLTHDVACNMLSAPRTDTMISFSRLFHGQNSMCLSWARNGPKNKVREKEHRAVSATRSVFTSERSLANDNAVATLYGVRTFLSGSPTLVSFNARNHDNTSCGDLPLFFLDSLDE